VCRKIDAIVSTCGRISHAMLQHVILKTCVHGKAIKAGTLADTHQINIKGNTASTPARPGCCMRSLLHWQHKHDAAKIQNLKSHHLFQPSSFYGICAATPASSACCCTWHSSLQCVAGSTVNMLLLLVWQLACTQPYTIAGAPFLTALSMASNDTMATHLQHKQMLGWMRC